MARRDPILRLLSVSLLVVFISGWVAFFSEGRSSLARRQTTFAQEKDEAYGPAIPDSLAKGCSASKIPVLMYHHIRRCPAGSACGARGSVEYGLSVEPELFERQMATLKKKGYRSILPRELAHGTVPCKSFVLTFDDGYDDNASVLPILEKYGFRGGFAIIIDRVDRVGYLRSSDIRRLVHEGHEILSHSLSHPNLAQLPDNELRSELELSKAAIESAFAVKVQGLVYPSGKYDSRVERAANRAGYTMAMTTVGGWADTNKDPFAMRRVRMSNIINADLSEVLR